MVIAPNQNSSNQNQVVPPKQPNLGKMMVANWASGIVTKIIVFVPVIAIWVLAYWFIFRGSWLAGLTPNVRGTLIIGIVVVPLIIAAFIQYKLRDYFYKKMER